MNSGSVSAALISVVALFLIMVGCLATASGAVQALVAVLATKVVVGKVLFFSGMSVVGVIAFIAGLKVENWD